MGDPRQRPFTLIIAPPWPLRYIAAMAWLKRSLLIWLLVLAVPAQGLAAATMALCGLNHSGLGPAATLTQAPLSGHGHQPGLATASPAAAQAQGPAFAHCEEMAADDPSSLPGSDSTSRHSCSVCATCCSVGALPNALLDVPAVAPAVAAFATVLTTAGSVVIDGLERPPRAQPA
jgi:hypothetical protein